MISKIINKATKVPTLVAAACCIAVMAGALPAHATDGSGMSTVFEVWSAPGFLRIYLTNDPNDYISYSTTPPDCGTWTQTADQLKNYAAMAQAALLSGKQLRITYNICPSSQAKHIDHMEIFQ